MNKRATGRAAKGKWFTLKYALQIFLLIGVCGWLIYQVKRSHDKKAELNVTASDENILALGRKGLDRLVETSKVNEEEDDDDEGDTRLEQEIEEAEMHHREEESRIEEKEREIDAKESEADGEEDEDKQDQNEEDGRKQLEDDLEEGDDDSHEAREENYKADDVSSEVAHEDNDDASGKDPRHLADNSTDTDEAVNFERDSVKNFTTTLGLNLTQIESNRKPGNETEAVNSGVENEESDLSTYESDASVDTVSEFGINGLNDRDAETE